jgi:hypothetical protein
VSYTTSKSVLGKEPITIVGIVYDKCSLTAGVSPCTATQTGDAKCFNTRATCNDTTNYTKTTEEIKFSQPRSSLPIGENMIPAIDGDVKKASTSVTAGKGLGKRAVVRVSIKDFPHHDRGIDPYVSERTYNPEDRGTFWGKFLSRNPYYEGRTLKVYYGYINDTFSWSDFVINEYDITDIDGPHNGKVTITAKDILIRTYGEKAQYPAKSNGKLLAAITSSDTSATLTPTGIGNSEYPASGYISIGKEAIGFTRSGDSLTLTRAQWGTTAKVHEADDDIQLCASWSGTNVVDVLDEILVTGAGIPSAYIPYDNGATGTNKNWDDEKDQWLSAGAVTGILMKPEGIDSLLAEFSEQYMFDIWWQADAQEVQIKALSPEPSGVTINTLTDGFNILKDSFSIKRDAKQRISEVQVWYNKTDYSEKDDIEFFRSARIASDSNVSSTDLYGSSSIKVIKSRWISTLGQASALAGRLIARFAYTPEVVTFDVGVKDDALYSMAGRVEVDSWQSQDFTGANDPKKYQVLEIDEVDPGHKVKVTALTSSFSGRYWFITPDGTADYSSATDADKAAYAWICLDTGLFSDGTDGYKII